MVSIGKLSGVVVLLLVGLLVLGLVDFGLNEARVLYAMIGRDRLVEACLPELRRGLESRGFSPADVEFEPRPRMSLSIGRPRSFGADFTFQDGAAETRIDGTMACVIGTTDVHVEFRTSVRPVRVG